MQDSTPTRLSFSQPRRTASHRFHARELDRVLPFRHRVALGYYDRPDLTEVAITRMLQMLNAQHN